MSEVKRTEDGNIFRMRWMRVNAGRKHLVPALVGHTMTAVPMRDMLLLFGGKAPGSKGDFNKTLYAFDVESLTWSVPTVLGTPPCPRIGHTATMSDGLLYVFGGMDVAGTLLNDLHCLDVINFKWHNLEVPGLYFPPPRKGHVAVAWEQHLIIHGGDVGKQVTNDIHILALLNPSKKSPQLCSFPSGWMALETSGTSPPGRAYHAATLVASAIVFQGGSDGTHVFSDTFALDLEPLIESAVTLRRGVQSRIGMVGVATTPTRMTPAVPLHMSESYPSPTLSISSAVSASTLVSPKLEMLPPPMLGNSKGTAKSPVLGVQKKPSHLLVPSKTRNTPTPTLSPPSPLPVTIGMEASREWWQGRAGAGLSIATPTTAYPLSSLPGSLIPLLSNPQQLQILSWTQLPQVALKPTFQHSSCLVGNYIFATGGWSRVVDQLRHDDGILPPTSKPSLSSSLFSVTITHLDTLETRNMISHNATASLVPASPSVSVANFEHVPPFPGRASHAMVAHRSRIFCYGGEVVSADASNPGRNSELWVLELAGSAFMANAGHPHAKWSI
ncbi:Acyl-CoA-binding domain-containing protein 5 [Phlyctochytrium planicorne]|nr:Acyl-CoA-binding domain-containing protein 5 [Phlyctochytrium planicorne]